MKSSLLKNLSWKKNSVLAQRFRRDFSFLNKGIHEAGNRMGKTKHELGLELENIPFIYSFQPP